ncbi:hypothetical protein [Streptomyces endophyticus]|uniref:Helix-turn-helix domain-containing protein n=1 Tax=Streptomyces endophyticus TaxID=714166 RepID=A0ABU6FJ05_9ACTN|nr:hypothetical protein [Streptomyces endophyticus]MEB8344030.1 hypothetical protein [Streptomyces endophyticus]
MRIHRTTPTRAFTVFANSLLRDRSISWCAAGVLMYLVSLPDGARATVRSLAEQRKEGRMRIAAALRELEESRYLRRVVRKDRETGQLSTMYEVFDTPYENETPSGEPEKVRNRASGVSPARPSGSLPSGERTGVQVPPSRPAEPEVAAVAVGPAARLLAELGRVEPRLVLGAAEAVRLAPLVEEWWEAGASNGQIRAALTQGLPRRMYSAAAIVEDRLIRKRPVAASAGPEAPVEVRRPGEAGFREAATRGAARVRAAMRGRPALA